MALVIGRKVDEAIIFRTADGVVKLTVMSIHGKTVRLAIDAPAAVKILRDELLDQHADMPPPCPRCGCDDMGLLDGVWECSSCGQRKRHLG